LALPFANRVCQKGFLTRTLQSRTHYYQPAIDYTEVREEAMRFSRASSSGSRQRLQEFLNGNSTVIHAKVGAESAAHPVLDETLL
jgi:predicted transcriptional regulator